MVSLGFFIEPTAKNRASVFSLDHGRSLEVEISQLIECDTAVAQRLDGDERLSTLRELFFYKYDGATKLSNVQTEPFFSYILLSVGREGSPRRCEREDDYCEQIRPHTRYG